MTNLTAGRLAVFAAAILSIALGNAAAAQDVGVAAVAAFTEGPTVDREGNVYFSELVSERIMKVTPKGTLSTFRDDSNNANGLLIDGEGRLVAVEGAQPSLIAVPAKRKPQVTRTNLLTGEVELLADDAQCPGLTGPNDVTVDGKGRLYFTDLPGAAVYRIDAPRKVTRILAAPEIVSPNGIQISPDDKTLYLIESNTALGGSRVVKAFDLRADGTVTNMRVHYDFQAGRGGDGMSIDNQGNLYVSAGLARLRGTGETLDNKAGVYVISPAGKLLRFIPIGEDIVTNNAFGGIDMKTLYVTAGKTLYKVQNDVAGLGR